jgi:protein-L-isoaspartate(D-aspartate) O-methyltransferase
MGSRNELNLGQLVSEALGEQSYRIGMGTDHGTVCAASNWDEPMEIMPVQPSHEDSYERLCHSARVPRFLLPLRRVDNPAINEALLTPHLQRAIGVIYRPETEMLSHYFQAVLPDQFDEFIWFDETRALHALHTKELAGVPETYPFGL